MANEVSSVTSSVERSKGQSSRALWGGILFSLAFSALIAWTGARLTVFPKLPDQGASWYYWKLAEPTFWSHATAWILYVLHQVSIWGLIYYAQTKVRKYTADLHPVNKIALGVNALFLFLHLLQTQVWYDGLAQDVSIWSSQGSVVLMLVAILLMENRRRGLFFGKPAPISQEIIGFVRRYHGYVFSWGAIYTFWYHPMENTPGHLVGFFYMFLLLLQGSLFFTRIHTNRWWTLVQEVTVLFHGTMVAVIQGSGIWPMFAFGFAGIFVITQMYGVPLKSWMRWAILGIFVGAVLLTYSQLGWGRINEVIRIPLIEYLLVFVLAGLVWLGLWIARRLGAMKSNA